MKKIVLLLFIFPFYGHFSLAQFPIGIQYKNGIVASVDGLGREFRLMTTLPATQCGDEKFNWQTSTITTTKDYTYFNHQCRVVNIVRQQPYGLDWEINITGLEGDWTVPVETSLQWNNVSDFQFWTTWPDNQMTEKTSSWNPLETSPFQDMNLIYGGDHHLLRKAFVIPIATTLQKNRNRAVSFIQSLNDTILDLKMTTTKEGSISYTQTNRRISSKTTIRIHHKIVVHQADWRDGMQWVCNQYPSYFNPVEPIVNQMAGGGAYSSYEGSFDAEKYRRMSFSFNWKASFDFPFMGMFLPPVKTETEEWKKFSVDGTHETSSIQQMRNYSVQFRKQGFYTLSYFNVTEFGNKIVYPYSTSNGDFQQANDLLYKKFSTAILRPIPLYPDWNNQPVFSNWEGCVVMDPFDSLYQDFLLEQAKRHIDKLPESSGICIDRLDWLRYYNVGDDEISLIGENRVRSLMTSWHIIMNKIGKMMHDNHKVIFCNPLYRRVDLMKHIDGYYDEYGQIPTCLNLTALMGMKKPVVAWTDRIESFQPSIDEYFQRHLYMGAFMTVPFPGNDHTITPNPEIEKYYLEYGALFNAIKEREWVLSPHVIEVEGEAKANIFKVKNQIIIFVMGVQAKLKIRLPDTMAGKSYYNLKTIYPGESWKPKGKLKYSNEMEIKVNFKRGCAMICLG